MTRASLSLAILAVGLSLPAMGARRGTATPGTTCSDTPKLEYSDGPLIQHVKVVDVFYSPGFPHKTMLEDYYRAILQSGYFDWLAEYSATNYKIGRGTFVVSFEDTNANPTTVKQVDPETYLKGLLAAGKLPAPDDDTMYMLYFPSGIDPADDSGPSCISNGDYCAYHSSYQAAGGQMIRYGVIPDLEAGACTQGCGPPGFASFTDVSSHELVEAVTDPDGSGWYDTGAPDTSSKNCGEIGDICAVGGAQETGTIGGFIVQKQWSNKNNTCIATDPNAALELPIGGSATTTVTAPLPPTGSTVVGGSGCSVAGVGFPVVGGAAGGVLFGFALFALAVRGRRA